ncbi:hypothetical protein F5B20DRAFT_11511 [Whalleya microplaca]|nr:hypothetical protein F5B20DRAFT_11511 [Whalleya microplaca]
MDGTPKAVASPAPNPAKGKAAPGKKASGKGVNKRAGKKQPPVKKGGRGKGRGRNKTYSDPRVQAAYERQRELRDLYSEVSSAVKPALEELADQNIKKLIEDPAAHKEVAEYDELQQQLDEQLAAAIRAAEQDLHAKTAIATSTYELDNICTQKKFQDSFDYRTEEFYDGTLNRSSILAELRREGVDPDVPDLTYDYVEAPDEIIEEQGPYVVYRNGVKVPCPSLLGEVKAAAKEKLRLQKAAPKRKAEDQPDGQPDSKKASANSGSAKLDNGDEAQIAQPRHIGGLLSAEKEPDGKPESNAPSPTPLDEEPALEQKTGPAAKKDLPDFPNGTSDPDHYGVRTVARRAPKANNRLIVPQTFQWDEGEIGFRDSTNDSTRKATRATRGQFLNKPNARNFHWDSTILYWNCLDYEDGDLDPELLEKHKLHPKYGFFMSDSVNESEAPSERVDGTRPVVVVTPNHTLHASRSVRAMKMDQALEADARKDRIASMLNDFCENEDIEPDDIVTDEMRERERQALERLATTPSVEEEDFDVVEVDRAQSTESDRFLMADNVNSLLHAASYLEMEKPVLPSTSPRPSRPYDAVRDVFTTAEPASAPPAPPSEIDTTGLSLLADMAEHVSYPAEQLDAVAYGDSSMIDPRLLAGSNQPPPAPNAFLQTALNPTPTFAQIAPAPVAPMEVPQQSTAPRIPFTNQASGSPVLPPLRPNRMDGPAKGPDVPQPQLQPGPPPPGGPAPRPQEFGSPRGLMQTNSGNFYPPAPPRPYHQGYSMHEPPLMPMPLQPQSHQLISGSSMMPNQPPPPPHRSVYPMMSPPMQSQPHLATMPVHMDLPGPSVSPPGSLMLASSPPAHAPRHRASIPSNGNASGKYRKIAAAPIPHNRPWQANGGTELRLAHYDHKEAIKDYRANEPPPRSGPTTIRGWNVNNGSKGRNRNVKKEESEEKESPNMISPFINKWNPSDKY